MDMLESILNAQGGGATRQLGKQFGLDDSQVSSASSVLVPALAAGFQRNMSSPQGLEGLTSALGGGQHQRYLDDGSALSRGETIADGNGILGHVFGSKGRQPAGGEPRSGADRDRRRRPQKHAANRGGDDDGHDEQTGVATGRVAGRHARGCRVADRHADTDARFESRRLDRRRRRWDDWPLFRASVKLTSGSEAGDVMGAVAHQPRRRNRCSFPVAVFGSSGTNSIQRGYL